MLSDLKGILNSEGNKAVELYRQSFIDGNRVATGKTNASVGYSIEEGKNSLTFTVFGRKDINQLEEGVSAEEYASNPATFSDLTQWIDAKGMNRTAESVDDGLRRNGWVSGNGEFGGTPNIITTPTDIIVKSVIDKVTFSGKDLIVKQINIKI